MARSEVATRGTTNGCERGSAEDRRRRKNWLLETYAADVQLIKAEYTWGAEVDHYLLTVEKLLEYEVVLSAEYVPTCRCYRCGKLLWFETLTVDRIIPGCMGGTYRRNNIRPACAKCNSKTGGPLANGKVHQPTKKRAAKKKVVKKRFGAVDGVPVEVVFA
jgi:5-methylcytosine-specific restriction endonuclease McrA